MQGLVWLAQCATALVRALWHCNLAAGLATAWSVQAAEPARDDVLRAEDQQRLRLLRELAAGPAPVMGTPARSARRPVPTHESRCFPMETLVVQGPPGAFFWRLQVELQDEWSATQGLCLGEKGLEAVLSNLTARMQQAGWITSKLDLPAQNLAAGELRVRWTPGIVESVHVEPGDMGLDSLPLSTGQALTVASLDQAADNYNRLPSLGARLAVLPGAAEQAHRINIDVTAGRPWRSSLSLDNTSAREYGRLRASWQLGVDRPGARLGLGSLLDQFLLEVSSNVEGVAPDRRSLAVAAQYAVPIGEHLIDLHAHHSQFGRAVAGTTVHFLNRGVDRSAGARWTWSALRTARSKWNLRAGFDREDSYRTIDDVELVLQRRLARRVEIGTSLWSRARLGERSIDWTVDASRSRTRRAGALGAFHKGAAFPMRESLVSAGAQGPLAAEGAGAAATPTWSVLLTVQSVSRPLDAGDLPIIGTRYVVRGFDGEASVQGQHAAVLRTDLKFASLPLSGGKLQAQPYLGLDAGTVRNPAAGADAARTLSGVAAGVYARAEQFSAEIAVALPLRRAPGRASASWVPTLRLTFDL